MANKQKVLLSTLVVGVLCGLTTLGVFGVFSATTQNTGNEISAGTVTISDNDLGSALYNVTGAKPGDSVSRCIKTTYTGSLPADVHLYTTSAPGPLAQYVDVRITKGTQTASTFPDCTGFTADAGAAIFSGTLQGFEQAHTSFATGINIAPIGHAVWLTGDNVVFKVDARLQASTPNTAQGSSSGLHTFVWEARNN